MLVLMVIRHSDSKNKRWTIVINYPHIPAGHLQGCEIPSGMIDGEKFTDINAQDNGAHTDLWVKSSELIDMTALASDESDFPQKAALYPSSGATNESIAIFFWEKILGRDEMGKLEGRC